MKEGEQLTNVETIIKVGVDGGLPTISETKGAAYQGQNSSADTGIESALGKDMFVMYCYVG